MHRVYGRSSLLLSMSQRRRGTLLTSRVHEQVLKPYSPRLIMVVDASLVISDVFFVILVVLESSDVLLALSLVYPCCIKVTTF